LKVPVPFVPEKEKENDESDVKPPQVKLTLDARCATITNPTAQVQPIFNKDTVEHYFKLINNISSVLAGQSLMEHYCLTLQSLHGTDKALWQREWAIACPQNSAVAGINP
jgi:hypothetical protein